MTDTQSDTERSDSTQMSEAAEQMVVFEFTVPADEIAMVSALEQFSSVIVEYERLVPTNHNPLPYLWTTDGATQGFKEAVVADPNIDQFTQIGTFEEGALYRTQWTGQKKRLLQWMTDSDTDVALLQAAGHDGEWTLKFRFPSRSELSAFRAFVDDHGIDLRVVRLYDLTDPKLGQYNMTEKQREALIRALEMGHFAVPREATLEEIADTLDISAKALSERLRRGQTNLISNSVTVGQLSGVGVNEH